MSRCGPSSTAWSRCRPALRTSCRSTAWPENRPRRTTRSSVDLVEHRQDVFAELRRVLAHREVADLLHDRHLDAGNLPGGAQRVLCRAGEVVLAGQQVEGTDLG